MAAGLELFQGDGINVAEGGHLEDAKGPGIAELVEVAVDLEMQISCKVDRSE